MDDKGKRLWEYEAETLQALYDSLPENLRVRQQKPKGYNKPDMEIPKGRKPRNRQKKWKQGKINNEKT